MALLEADKEKQLVRLLQHGDNNAMGEVYNVYAGYLTGVCARYISDDERLHDVLQESFITIFTKCGNFEYRGEGSFQAWMKRIVVIQSLRELQSLKTRQSLYTDDEPPDLPDEEPQTQGLSADVITAMLRRLPPGYREVFNLHAIEGLSHKEIAARLGIQPDTSASQFHRAKKILAKLIKEYNANKK